MIQEDKKISIIGVGKLGLCLSLNLERKGFDVLGCDVSEDYIDQLNNKNFQSNEPQVNSLLSECKNINFTTDLKKSLEFSDVLFLLVATPSLQNGKYDHSQIESVISKLEILGRQENRKFLIVGCTTYPGYCDSISERLDKLNYEILYNPEFIAQGNIINDQLSPDMVLIGETSKEAGDKLEFIHREMCENNPHFSRMSLTEAELTKLSINCFITTKISFANMIGDLCNELGISHKNVLHSIGKDSRIGGKYLNWGFGFGGPCFPRDNRALGILCSENNIEPTIPTASDSFNNLHIQYHAKEIEKTAIDNKIIFDGVSYKKNSVLIEESQQLKMAVLMSDLGYEVTIVDNKYVIDSVEKIYANKFKYEIR
jgi:UDPglucose 6-dehydrogenase